jgi:hypothetical protein
MEPVSARGAGDSEESSLTRYNGESLPYYARSGRNEESVRDNVYPVRKVAETGTDQYRLSKLMENTDCNREAYVILQELAFWRSIAFSDAESSVLPSPFTGYPGTDLTLTN